MILRWPSEVPVSECFEFREKVAKGLSRVWGNARNAGIRNPETTVLAESLSSGTCSLSLSTPAPLPKLSLQASSTGRASCSPFWAVLTTNESTYSMEIQKVTTEGNKIQAPSLVSYRPVAMCEPALSTTAAAAKSLQSCPTLCDPIDGSPPGSSTHGIFQASVLEWVAISFSNAWKWKVKVKSLSCVRLLATLWTAAHQAPPPVGFSRQEYWSGVPLQLQSGQQMWQMTHRTFICSTSAIPNLMYKLGTGRKFSHLPTRVFYYDRAQGFLTRPHLLPMFTHSSNKHVLI